MKLTFAWWHILLILLPILPNLWSIWNIWTNSFKDYNQKIIWLVTAIFIPLLGGLLYIFIGHRYIIQTRANDKAGQ